MPDQDICSEIFRQQVGRVVSSQHFLVGQSLLGGCLLDPQQAGVDMARPPYAFSMNNPLGSGGIAHHSACGCPAEVLHH